MVRKMVYKRSMTAIGLCLFLGTGRVVQGTETKHASSLLHLWNRAGNTVAKKNTLSTEKDQLDCSENWGSRYPLCDLHALFNQLLGQDHSKVTTIIMDYCGIRWKKYRSFVVSNFASSGKVAFAVCKGKRVLLAPYDWISGIRHGGFEMSFKCSATAWNLESGLQDGDIPGDEASLVELYVAPDGKKIVTYGGDKRLRIYETSSLKQLAALPAIEFTGTVVRCGFSQDGKWMAVAATGAPISIWDLMTFKQIKEFPQSDFLQIRRRDIDVICFSPDSKLMALRLGEYMEVWDVEKKQIMHAFSDPSLRCNFNSLFFRDNTHVVVSRKTGAVEWDLSLPSDEMRLSRNTKYFSGDCYFEPSLVGIKRVAYGNGIFTRIMPPMGSEGSDKEEELNLGPDVRSIAFSPCGKFFAVVDKRDALVQVYHKRYDVGE